MNLLKFPHSVLKTWNLFISTSAHRDAARYLEMTEIKDHLNNTAGNQKEQNNTFYQEDYLLAKES